MAAPLLALRPWTIAQSLTNGVLDLSVLTCPGGVYSDRLGTDGSDWLVISIYGASTNPGPGSGYTLFQYANKNVGEMQLTPYPFGPDGTLFYNFQNTFLSPQWAANDYRLQTQGAKTSIGSSSVAIAIPDAYQGCGLRVPGLIAKRGQRRSAYFLWRVDSGSWVVSASIADGSSPSVSLPALVAPSNSFTDFAFAVDYTPGPNGDSIVTLEARIVDCAATYSRFIAPQVSYITTPKVLRLSRGHREYMRSHGAFGGVYA